MSGNCAINFHRYHFNKILVVFRCFGEIEKLSLFLGLSGIFTGPLMVLLGNMVVFKKKNITKRKRKRKRKKNENKAKQQDKTTKRKKKKKNKEN
jgi:flagellar biosynthesis component FlhA